jgi:hypothetical protein
MEIGVKMKFTLSGPKHSPLLNITSVIIFDTALLIPLLNPCLGTAIN